MKKDYDRQIRRVNEGGESMISTNTFRNWFFNKPEIWVENALEKIFRDGCFENGVVRYYPGDR